MMITTTKNNESPIFTFVIEGEIEGEDVSQLMDALEQQPKNQEGKISLLAEVRKVDDLDFDTLKEFFSVMSKKFEAISYLRRYAIVTDLDWISRLVPVSNFLTPGLPMRVFSGSEKSQAIAWLEEEQEDDRSAIRPIALPDHPTVLGYAVDGKIESSDYDLIDRQLEQMSQRSEKAKLYLEVLHLEGMTLSAMWKDTKAGLEYASSLDKVALVSTQEWIEDLAEAGDLVTPGIDMEFFDLNRRQEVLNWLVT